MKLLHKTTRNYLLASISILIITGIALFSVLRKDVSDEMNEHLALEADELFRNAEAGTFAQAPRISIQKVSAATPLGQLYGDSLIYDHIQQEMEEYHFLKETQDLKNGRYQVVVMTSHIGWDKYYMSILYIFLLTAFLLTGSGVLINYLSNKQIWTPFFNNLKKVQEFSVSSPTDLQLTASSIHEFKELNATLKDLTDRSRREYLALREFTENASHEIQTPLSIIQSKLDRMSQLDIDADMAGYIVQAKSGVDRLSRVNKSLLLLAKLDNKIFDSSEAIQLDERLTTHLANMEELFASKNIQSRQTISPTVVYSDPYLTDTLLTNLLSNALRYTPQQGQVNIELANHTLRIANSGTAPDFPKEYIFERFIKSQSNSSSTGLGLAIVKEICTLNQWKIKYDYQHGEHCFEVCFK